MVEIDEKQAFGIISKAKETGSIKIGANEVTKSLERGQTKLVVSATDVSPAEIVAHFSGLCKEMGVLYLSAGTKAELGSLAGIKSTTVIGVVDAGSAAKEIDSLLKENNSKDSVGDSKKESNKEEETTEENQ